MELKVAKTATKKRITLYLMESVRTTAQDTVMRLYAKSLGEVILTLAKYYLYLQDPPTDTVVGQVEELYTGTVTTGNNNVYKYKVEYTDVEVEILRLLADKYQSTISKITNYLAILASSLTLPQYNKVRTQVLEQIGDHNLWLLTELNITSLDYPNALNKFYEIYDQVLQNDPVYNNPTLPQNLRYNHSLLIKPALVEKIFLLGLKLYKEDMLETLNTITHNS